MRLIRIYFTILLLFCFSPVWAISVSGTVSGLSGGIASATVVIKRHADDVQLASALSDAGGAYAFDVVAGNYYIEITPPVDSGYAFTQWQNIVVDTSPVLQDISLSVAEVAVSGVVYLADGSTPASQVQISLYDESNLDVILQSRLTTSDGSYSFTLNALASYTLSVAVDGNSNTGLAGLYIDKGIVNSLVPQTDMQQDILLPLATITGKTTDPLSNAITGVSVIVQSAQISTGIRERYFAGGQTESDTSGNYSIVVPKYSGYTLRLLPAVGEALVQTSYLSGVDFSSDGSQDLQLQSPALISGSIKLADGSAVSGVLVQAYNILDDTYMLQSNLSDSQGNYSLEVAANSSYGLHVTVTEQALDGLPGQYIDKGIVSNLVIANGATQNIILPLSVASGFTVDSVATAVADVSISSNYVSIIDTGERQAIYYGGSIRSDISTGAYRLYLPVFDNYTLSLSPPSGSSGLADTVLTAQDHTMDVQRDLVLLAGHRLSGVVTDQQGNGLENVLVEVFDESSDTVILASKRTATDGSYQFNLEADRTYGLQVSLDPADDSRMIAYYYDKGIVANLLLQQDTVRNIQTPLVAVSGVVRDENAVAIAGVAVQIDYVTTYADANRITALYAGAVTSGVGGEFSFMLPSFSSYTVNINSDAGKNYQSLTLLNQDFSGETLFSPRLVYQDASLPIYVDQPTVAHIGPNSAWVYWQTDERSGYELYYGQSSPPGLLAGSGGYLSRHAHKLEGLLPGTTYYLQVQASDDGIGEGVSANGQVASQIISFTTTDTPAVPAVALNRPAQVSAIAADSVVIQWQTNWPATSSVSYGADLTQMQVVNSTELHKEHRVVLTSLLPDTEYYFYVTSDNYGPSGSVVSDTHSFRTASTAAATPLQFTEGPYIDKLLDDGFVISWATNRISTGAITLKKAGLYYPYSSSVTATRHRIPIRGLEANTFYEAIISSVDVLEGVAVNEVLSLTTAVSNKDTRVPNWIQRPMLVERYGSRGLLTLQTDEPVFAGVRLSDGVSTWQLHSEQLSTRHQFVLNDLQAGQSYQLEGYARDEAQNASQSSVYQFTVPDTESVINSLALASEPQVHLLSASQLLVEVNTVQFSDVQVRIEDENGVRAYVSSEYWDKQHMLVVDGLQSNTVYSVHLTISGVAAQPLQIGPSSHATLLVDMGSFSDLGEPTLSADPRVIFNNDSVLLVELTWDQPVEAFASYGPAGTLTQRSASVGLNYRHVLSLPLLESATIYDIQPAWRQRGGSTWNSSIPGVELSAVEDSAAPSLSFQSVMKTAGEQIVVSLHTDEVSIVQMYYGPQAEQLNSITSSVQITDRHRLYIPKLLDADSYYYMLEFTDLAGNSWTSPVAHFSAQGLALEDALVQPPIARKDKKRSWFSGTGPDWLLVLAILVLFNIRQIHFRHTMRPGKQM